MNRSKTSQENDVSALIFAPVKISVLEDALKEVFPDRKLNVNETGERTADGTTVIKLYHPIYDLFQPDPNFDAAAYKKEHGLRQNVEIHFWSKAFPDRQSPV